VGERQCVSAWVRERERERKKEGGSELKSERKTGLNDKDLKYVGRDNWEIC